MEIETESAVEHFFPSSSFSQIYLEAIANSLDAGAADISIKIGLTSFLSPNTLRVTITDDGCGFTDDSFVRFSRLLKAQDAFHKGIGRLIYLRYFRKVEVESHFGDKIRQFTFNQQFKGKSTIQQNGTSELRKTTLTFEGFTGERIKSYDDVRPAAIKDRVVKEFLPRLYELQQSNNQLRISIEVDAQQGNPEYDFYNETQTFNLNELPKLKEVDIEDNVVDMFSGIKMAYRIEQKFGKNPIVTAACVDRRTIQLDLIPAGSVPSNYAVICLFYSDYFKGKADSARQKLDLPDAGTEKVLLLVLRKHLAKVISEEIPTVNDKNNATKGQFLKRFPHLLGYFEEETVGLIQSDEALEIAQKRFFKDQKEILESDHLDDSKFQKSLEISSRTLTEYVLYRNLIIKKLSSISEKNSEEEIHDLIIPRYKTYKAGEVAQSIYSNNAWILDDKFMSFSTILSEVRMDKLIKEITLDDEQASDDSRPDISIIFSGDPKATDRVDVVIVELKKRTDDEKDNSYAITQLYQRAVKLIKNCPNIQRIWYYAVLQINETFSERLSQSGFSPLFSKGKVFYREALTKAPDGTNIPTPIFVLSFDAIIKDAESRNSTFLTILREQMKQLSTPKT